MNQDELFDVNADDDEDTDAYPTAESGRYYVKVTDVDTGRTKDSNRPLVTLKIAILGADGNSVANMLHYITIIPKGESGAGMWRSANKAFGLPYKGDNCKFSASDYIGRTARADIVKYKYEGKNRNKIGAFVVEGETTTAPSESTVTPDNVVETVGLPPEDDIPF